MSFNAFIAWLLHLICQPARLGSDLCGGSEAKGLETVDPSAVVIGCKDSLRGGQRLDPRASSFGVLPE